MKRMWMISAAAFIFTAMFFTPLPVCASDEVFPLMLNKCSICKKAEFYAFLGDAIYTASSKSKEADPKNQASNWVFLSGKQYDQHDKCIKKGAHYFHIDLAKQERRTLKWIYENKDKIVIKKYDNKTKIPYRKWFCVICKKEGYYFAGDNMGHKEKISFGSSNNMQKFSDGSKLDDCKGTLINGRDLRFHILSVSDTNDLPTYLFAQNLKDFYFSTGN